MEKHFFNDSEAYRKFRPDYPKDLFSYLASITEEHSLALDCGTGTGQVAKELAQHFNQVIGIDISEPQVINAIKRPNMNFFVSKAEKIPVKPSSVDLITVAQALHWFNFKLFFKEVERVLKPKGVLAVFTYNLLKMNPGMDRIIEKLYYEILRGYWPKERVMVEKGYENIYFPFKNVDTKEFEMKTEWSYDQLIGYLNTWSSVRKYLNKNNKNPLEIIEEDLKQSWYSSSKKNIVKWRLKVKTRIKSPHSNFSPHQP